MLLENITKRLKNLYKRLKTPTPICLTCFNPIKELDFSSFFGKNRIICRKCEEGLNPKMYTFYVKNYKALAIYDYDDMIKSLIYQFKGCSDIVLKDIFLYQLKEYLYIKFKDYYMIPAPSYKNEDLKRGFNHVEQMFSCLKVKMIKLFYKSENVKQSSGSYIKRTKIENIIKMSDIKDVKNKKILLVDDIYTTGSTMKTMVSLIEKQKPRDIKILLVAKTTLH